MAAAPLCYILHIQLEPLVLNPPIWRRMAVSGDITLRKLHHYIQAAMGWESAHLYEFEDGRNRYLPPDAIDDMGLHSDQPLIDDRKKTLRAVAKAGDRLRYLYDFGDSWMHVIAVEEIRPAPQGGNFCMLMDGEGACPPEDCGGAPGYLGMLELLAGPPGAEQDELLEWLGGEIDPEYFDTRLANSAIMRIQNNFWG